MGSYLWKPWNGLEKEENSDTSDEELDVEHVQCDDINIHNINNTGNNISPFTPNESTASIPQLTSTSGEKASAVVQRTPTNIRKSLQQLFQVGDVVLLRNSKSNINLHSQLVWKDPYIVLGAFNDGYCLLESADGERFMENMEDLRLYLSPRIMRNLVDKLISDSCDTVSNVQLNKACKRKSMECLNDIGNKSVKLSAGTNQQESNIWIRALHLTQAEKRLILNGQELTDIIIDAAQVLLKLQYNANGLDSCLQGQTEAGYDDLGSTPSVQIHFDETRKHWLTSIATVDNDVLLCDSLPSHRLSTSMTKQLLQRYGSRAINETLCVTMQPVDQQQNAMDCGLYAIAYAVESLVENGDLMKTFNPSLLRSHLVACLEASDMKSFPGDQKSNSLNAGEVKNIYIPV